MMYMGFWELKTSAKGDSALENQGTVFQSEIGILSTDNTAVRELVGFGNNKRKHLKKPEEERRKTMNAMELLRGPILGVYLHRSLGILRIIWKKFNYGCE